MKFYRLSSLLVTSCLMFLCFMNGAYANAAATSVPEYLPVVKLSPQTTETPLKTQAIDYAMLKPHFSYSRILPKRLLLNMPYVLALADDHLVLGETNNFYARGFNGPLVPQDCRETHPGGCRQNPCDRNVRKVYVGQRWQVVRIKDSYFDPITQESLGTLAEDVGEAEVIRDGDPVTLRLIRSSIEMKLGDRLVPVNSDQNYAEGLSSYRPDRSIEAEIIDVFGGVTSVGSYQTVVLNVGRADRLRRGALFTIYKPGKPVNDRIERKMVRYAKSVPLPHEPVGTLLVYRVFEHTSLGLVLKAEIPMKISYLVRGTGPLSTSFAYDTEANS